MNKQEFANALRRALDGYPTDEVERSVAFYIEMIDDCMENGMTETDAVASVGSVEEVARKIREEMMPYGWGARAGLSGASHFVVFLANKREDITFGSPYADHMLKDIHQVPPEVYDFYSQVYTRFGKEEMKILDSERTALDWTSKQAYIVMANMMTMAAYMGIDSCPLEGFNPADMTRLLGEEHHLFDTRHYGIAVMAAFGYRAETPHRDKSRKPLSESVEWVK